MQIDGSTRIVGVFGHPIAHTASPAMHNAAFDRFGMNWRYLAFDVDPARLGGALHGIADLNFAGVNLTVPHKILALDIVDEVDKQARLLGAVNTVIVDGHELHGFNTDGYGFVRGLREDFGLELRGRRVLILGAGGAGRALAIQAAMDGAAAIFLANRTVSKAFQVVGEIRKIVPHAFTVALPLQPAHIAKHLDEVDLVVNATSIGLGDDASPIPAQILTPDLFVLDLIYRPTRLLREAASAGCTVSDGETMLLHQGAAAFTLWTGQPAPVEVMQEALQAARDGGVTSAEGEPGVDAAAG